MALSDLTVRRIKASDKDFNLSDTDGLSLFVPTQGRKAWHFRYYWLGKRSRISFGTYPEVSLGEARVLRDEARTLLAKGLNPRLFELQRVLATHHHSNHFLLLGSN